MIAKKYALSKNRFHAICEQFKGKKILIVGDVGGVDRYTMGAATRLSQEAPVPIVRVISTHDKLGMAGNVADNIQTFGATPWLAALIGEDKIGKELVSLLSEQKIPTQHIHAHASRRTSLKERIIAQSQQVVRVDHESPEPLEPAAENFFLSKLAGVVAQVDRNRSRGLCQGPFNGSSGAAFSGRST